MTLSAVTLTSIENVSVGNYDQNGNVTTIDMANASGVQKISLNGSSATGDTTFTSVKAIANAEMMNGTGDLTLTYADAAVSGTADVQNLTVSGVTAGTFAVNAASTGGVETLAVTSTGGSTNTLTGITDATTLTTVTVAGDAALKIGTVGASVTTLDASANTAGLTATLNTTATIAVKGSAGNDTITTGAALTTGSVNAGAGTGDALVTTANAHINSTTLGGKYTNFETLNISQTESISTDVDWTDRSQDVSLVSGVTKIGLTSLSLTSTYSSDNTNNGSVNVGFTNLTAGVTDLAISGLSYTDTDAVPADDDVALTVTAGRQQDTTTDSLTVTLGTSTAAAGNVSSGTDALTLDVTLNDEETLSIVSQGGANTISTLSASDLKTLNISGNKALTISTISGNTATSIINASANTGGVTIGVNASTTASVITGGAGNDNLLGGTKADSLSGAAGNDTLGGAAGNDTILGGDGDDSITGGADVDSLSGGAGNDTFVVATAGDFQGLVAAESIDGGEGNDTLDFQAAMTLASSDFGSVSSVETIKFSNAGNSSVTLADSNFGTNTIMTITDGDLTSGSLTVVGSALTAKHDLVITGNTTAFVNDSLVGGAGNDTFKFSGTTGLANTDTITGGTGTDTIELKANAAVTVALNGVTGIERIVSTGSGTTDADDISITLGADTVLAASTTLTIDTSSQSNGAPDTLVDASALTTATKNVNVTTGAGVDTVTGGAGNDIVSTGAGSDSITGGAGIDNLSGGEGDDTFVVATAAHFIGLTAAETVSGGAGNDILKFTSATTTVNATDLTSVNGVETIEFNGTGASSITLTDAVFTANGATTLAIKDTDGTAALTVSASSLSAANSVQVTANSASGIDESLAGGAGNDTFSFSTSGSATALDANDSVNGGAGTDTLAITVVTTSSAATLTNVSNIEKITVTGTTNVNLGTLTLADANFANITGAVIDASGMTASAGTVSVTAAAEDDSTFVITGGINADTLVGGQLADTISGGVGNDNITGGKGADSLTGGSGVDTFVYTSASVSDSSGSTIDTITDFTSGTDKIQVTLNYSAFAAAVDVNTNFVSTIGDLSAKRGEVVYDSTASKLFVNVNNDNLITTQDFTIGTGTVAAGDVNFSVTGTALGDTIIGGAGADTISAGEGADSIDGGLGNDSITIGADTDNAVDTIVFSQTSGKDTVTGFELSEDILKVTIAGANGGEVAVNGAAGAIALTSDRTYIALVDASSTAWKTGGAETVTDFTDLTDVAAYLGEKVTSTASGDTGLFLLNDGTDSYAYYFAESAGAASTISASELTLVGVFNSAVLVAADVTQA